jgi:hypothetical protein
MTPSEMTARSPLRAFDQRPAGGLAPGQLGLIAARAGTGKTAFLIQVALDAILRGDPVMHVALGETVGDVRAWYAELLRGLAAGASRDRVAGLLEEAERKRLILTLRPQAFGPERLEQRLADLEAHGVFRPRVLAIDGVDPDSAGRAALEALAALARARDCAVWLACRVGPEAGAPASLVDPVRDLFAVIVGLDPEADRVALTVLQNPCGAEGRSPVALDPRTLLLTLPRAP